MVSCLARPKMRTLLVGFAMHLTMMAMSFGNALFSLVWNFVTIRSSFLS